MLIHRHGAGVSLFRTAISPIWSSPSAGSASMRLNPDGTLNRSLADPLQNLMCITGASTGRDFRFGLRLAF